MVKLIEALTELVIAATEYLNRLNGSPVLPGMETATTVEVKKERKPRTPKVEPVSEPKVEDQLGIGLGESEPTMLGGAKELTPEESIAKMEEITTQYVTLTKNDKPEDGKTKAIRLMKEVFKVGKLGDLTHPQRLKWIAEMEKGIREHK